MSDDDFEFVPRDASTQLPGKQVQPFRKSMKSSKLEQRNHGQLENMFTSGMDLTLVTLTQANHPAAAVTAAVQTSTPIGKHMTNNRSKGKLSLRAKSDGSVPNANVCHVLVGSNSDVDFKETAEKENAKQNNFAQQNKKSIDGPAELAMTATARDSSVKTADCSRDTGTKVTCPAGEGQGQSGVASDAEKSSSPDMFDSDSEQVAVDTQLDAVIRQVKNELESKPPTSATGGDKTAQQPSNMTTTTCGGVLASNASKSKQPESVQITTAKTTNDRTAGDACISHGDDVKTSSLQQLRTGRRRRLSTQRDDFQYDEKKPVEKTPSKRQ